MSRLRRSLLMAVAFCLVVTVAAAVVTVAFGLRTPPAPILRYDQSKLVAVEPVAKVIAEPQESESASAPASGQVGDVIVDPAWIASTAGAAGIPEPAIRAYAVAQVRLAKEKPDCQLGWTTLAGIGWIESQHGTIDGRVLEPDGTDDRPIIGPALNGQGPVAAIRATAESTQWHGDPTWDHAVGPLQFLPSSWGTWGGDGDGDGTADPNDLDDAAYAAGQYLCDSGSLTGEGWAAAIFSYNHDNSYVESVYNAAVSYAEATK